jgi:hypothetical protein
VVAKAKKKTQVSRKRAVKEKAIAVPFLPCVTQCVLPCFEVTVEFNQQTLVLDSIELFDAANNVWAAFQLGVLDANGIAAGMAALRNVTRNVNVLLPCPEPGCECHLPALKPPFTPWANVNISGGFSIPAPMGGPPLAYRANGTVDMRSRVTVGVCKPVVIDA